MGCYCGDPRKKMWLCMSTDADGGTVSVSKTAGQKQQPANNRSELNSIKPDPYFIGLQHG